MKIADIPMVEPTVQGRIAFARMKSGYYPSDATWDIYTVNANGTDLRQITNGAKAYEFAFSPDGTQIAYVNRINTPKIINGISQLWVMNADGTNPICIETAVLMNAPQWTSDGKRLIYAAGKGEKDYAAYIIHADGSNRRSFQSSDMPSILSPTWKPDEYQYIHHRVRSPDGTKVALIGVDYSGYEFLHVAAVADMDMLQFEYAKNEYNTMIPAWSADSREIAFVSFPPERFWGLSDPELLYILDVSSGDIRRLVDVHFGNRHEVYPSAPVWSRDGSWIAFIGLYDLDGVSDDIYLVNPDGSNLRRVTTDGLPKCNLVWQPVI